MTLTNFTLLMASSQQTCPLACVVELQARRPIIHQESDEAPVGVLSCSKPTLFWLALALQVVYDSQLCLVVLKEGLEVVLWQVQGLGD